MKSLRFKTALILSSALMLAACQVDREDVLRDRAKVKEPKPIQVNFEKLNEQEIRLKELFTIRYKPLKYTMDRSPFNSLIDEANKSMELAEETSNPLLNIPVSSIKITGVLTGKVGNIAVITAGGNIYYVKVGDVIGQSRATVLYIGQDYIRLRVISRDIFGNKKAEIREIRVSDMDKEKDS